MAVSRGLRGKRDPISGRILMKVSQVMTPAVRVIHPDDTLQTAAQVMCECDVGFLPVGLNDRLIGTITDRDIAVRAVATGCAPGERVGEFMSRELKYCFDDDDIDDVMDNMAMLKLRRLPVVNNAKRLVGVLSLTDAALECEPRLAGKALSRIGRPGGAHSQIPMSGF
jgi:CBS domain-containing protein